MAESKDDVKRSLSDTWGTEMVTIYVGATRKKFVLHKTLICQLSPFFDGMFNGGLSEGHSQECSLVDDDAAAFEVFISRAYKQIFPNNCSEVVAAENDTKVYDSIVRFYSLADKLLLPKAIKVEAMRALVKARKDSLSTQIWPGTVAFALKDLAEDCPMRKLVVDLAGYEFICATRPQSLEWRKWLLKISNDVKPKHTVELVMAMQEKAGFNGVTFTGIQPKAYYQTLSTPDLLPRYITGFLKAQK